MFSVRTAAKNIKNCVYRFVSRMSTSEASLRIFMTKNRKEKIESKKSKGFKKPHIQYFFFGLYGGHPSSKRNLQPERSLKY
jgi:hypothetical protein